MHTFDFFSISYIYIKASSKNVCFLLDKFYNIRQIMKIERNVDQCFGEMRQKERTKNLSVVRRVNWSTSWSRSWFVFCSNNSKRYTWYSFFFFCCCFRFYPWLLFVFYTIGTIHCELYFFYIFLEKRIEFITLWKDFNENSFF